MKRTGRTLVLACLHGSFTLQQADSMPGTGIKFRRKSGGTASARLCEREAE